MSDIAIDYNNSDILYAASGDHDAFDNYSVGIYKSIDGGESWSLSYNANDGAFGNWSAAAEGWGIGQHPYEQDSKLNFTISRILISPDDSNKIIASTRKGILYTENAGNTWAMATKSDDSDLDDEFHDIEFKPGDSNVAYAGAEGGFGNLWMAAYPGQNPLFQIRPEQIERQLQLQNQSQVGFI